MTMSLSQLLRAHATGQKGSGIGRAIWAAEMALASALALTSLASRAAPGADNTVSGVVLDSIGRPVAGARVGTSFGLSDTAPGIKVQVGYSDPAVVTDALGRFSLAAAPIAYTHVLVAAGPYGALGTAIKHFPGQTTLRLAPRSRMELHVDKRFGTRGGATSFDVMLNGSAVAYGMVHQSGEFIVPQGSFELRVFDDESLTITEPLVVTSPGVRVRVRLKPTLWARNLGKPAPALTPTDIENWPSGRPLSALRGKWVLVTFWATWCVPCVEEMPKVVRFYKEHSSERDRFEILAIHSADGKSFAAIQPAYQRLVKMKWSGQSLPFPLLFDSTGDTQRRWGIEAYPTTLLISPQAKLVGPGNIEELAKKIAGG